MFAKETKNEIIAIVRSQIDEIKSLKDMSSGKDDFDMNEMNYGCEGDKKTILKPAQGNSTKLAIAAQTCLFQMIQQIDVFKDQIYSLQKRREMNNTQEMITSVVNFLNNTKNIRARDDFREIFGGKN